jgi:hypothetical protein
MNRRSFSNAAISTVLVSGQHAWKNSPLSLLTKMAAGCSRAIDWVARMLARVRCFRQVTNPRSDRSCSFHTPSSALIFAVTYISFTGVYSRTHG